MFIEVNEDLFPRFKTKEEKKNHQATLEFWKWELHEHTNDDFIKFSRFIRKDLTSMHMMLFSIFNESLRNRIEMIPSVRLWLRRTDLTQ